MMNEPQTIIFELVQDNDELKLQQTRVMFGKITRTKHDIGSLFVMAAQVNLWNKILSQPIPKISKISVQGFISDKHFFTYQFPFNRYHIAHEVLEIVQRKNHN
jgi:hypothetical protein